MLLAYCCLFVVVVCVCVVSCAIVVYVYVSGGLYAFRVARCVVCALVLDLWGKPSFPRLCTCRRCVC